MSTLYLVGPTPTYRGMRVLEQACRDAGVNDWVLEPLTFASDEAIGSKFIVTLGSEAFRIFVKDKIKDTDARGYMWDTGMVNGLSQRRVFATIHPDFCDKQWVPYRKLLEVDLRKAKAELDAGCPPFPEREVVIVTNKDELLRLYQELDNRKWIALDIENDKNLELSCLGIGVSPNLAYVIPAGASWQLDAIKDICENDVPKVLQNGQYDATFLKYRNDIMINNFVFDTMLAWHTYMPELAGAKEDSTKKKKAFRKTEKSLRFLGSIFCRVEFWKNYDFERPEDQLILCGKDNCLTLEIAEELERLIA